MDGRRLSAAVTTLLALALASCGKDPQDFDDIGAGPPAPDLAGPGCDYQYTYEDPGLPTGDPAPVPYPTPAGGTVAPRIRNVPLPPDAVRVDGFNRRKRTVVEVFETGLSADEVLAFFDTTLRAASWNLTGTGSSSAGMQCDFMPGRQMTSETFPIMISVSTAYIPRPGEENRGQPPPGYTGFAVPFASPLPDRTRFWLVTRN